MEHGNVFRKEAKLWLLNQDGSSKTQITFLDERNTAWEAKTKTRPLVRFKAGHTMDRR
ncbi:hypothetical protein ACFL1B_03585 [Nanoarchaeota archaeon]